MAPVKAAPVDPTALALRFAAAGEKAGFRQEPYGQSDGHLLSAMTRRTTGVKPRIYLSSGIHGDEPAPPLALLSLLEAGEFDDRATWFLCPMLNPAGAAAATRENGRGVDLNRDYRQPSSPEVQAHVGWLQRQPSFDVGLCLHEDWESTGFYLYELNPDSRASLAEPMISAASQACPIDMSAVIEGREAKGGIIRPPGNPLEREKWPESLYLLLHHTRLTYTLESPSALALDVRISALRAAVRVGIDRTVNPRIR